ncbi:hypothetical protein GQ53DRAFT_719454 [Thozetella sp. PMI_491]|nr:hypothetical protein GQ53DRAFT_719454 [Thozetella sp. PMI_491]
MAASRAVAVPTAEGNIQPSTSTWARWYQPGSGKDREIYADALKKCKEINENLNAEPFLERDLGFVASKIRESSEIWVPRSYDAAWVTAHIERECQRIQNKQSLRKEWAQVVSKAAHGFASLVVHLKPVIDVFVPQSPEYTVPYACILIIFKGFAARKTKTDSVLGLIKALEDDMPLLEAYGDMFPTDVMKTALAQLYLQTADLLWRLARYYAKDFMTQLADALFPRAQFDFAVHQGHIKKTAEKLKILCETGHIAEQRDMRDRVDNIALDLRHISEELYQMSGQLESSRQAHSQRLVSELIDIWQDDVGDVEEEVQLWDSLRLWTDRRDHWSENGILRHLAEWQKERESHNSVLWICSENNGRQAWMTELSVDLLRVCRGQNQVTAFALCDRPGNVRWTPRQVLQQLVSQLLIQAPKLTTTNPSLLCPRAFRKATTFDSTFRLLHSLAGLVESLVIVIDRLDLCELDPDDNPDHTIAQALSILVKSYPKSLRIFVTTAQVVTAQMLPGLPICFSEVKTRRRPRRRFDDRPKRYRPLLIAPRVPPPRMPFVDPVRRLYSPGNSGTQSPVYYSPDNIVVRPVVRTGPRGVEFSTTTEETRLVPCSRW